MNQADLEQFIEQHDLTNPRVTLDVVEDNIVCEYYFTAGEGVEGATKTNGPSIACTYDNSLNQVTFCLLLLKNGFKIVGVNEGPVSSGNFNPELGRKLAREDAIEQVWPLMGYALAERLNSTVH